MQILPEGRTKIKVGQVMWITVFWTIVAGVDVLNTKLILGLGSQVFESNWFSDFFWASIWSGFFGGIISGSFLVFFLREYSRTKTFGFALLVNSFIISFINFGISAIIFRLILGGGQRTGLADIADPANGSLVWQSFYVRRLLFWSGLAFVTIVSLHINEKYGYGVLRKLLLGRYHRATEEERIFMFVDLKSSTTIAEKLGHTRFFNLLNDFFRDITNPIIYTSGRVYQYVGDEVVIVWDIDKGLRNANCIRCFYSMQEVIAKNANYYLEKYGIIPEFKAGLHTGMVTVGEIGVIKKDIVFSGDVLNTASRIQSMCNNFGVKLLLSKYLLEKLQLPPHLYFVFRVGFIELRGKKKRVELFSVEENLSAETLSGS